MPTITKCFTPLLGKRIRTVVLDECGALPLRPLRTP
jgi:hypothetical protein